jgi:Uma2 family endonuclease
MTEIETPYPPPGERCGLTYEDYCALPDDGLRYEIIDGALFAEPSPRPVHQEVALRLATLLDAHVRARGLGKVYIAPIDVILDRPTVVVPDLIFVSRNRLGIVADRGVEGAPDLVGEILSPGTARRDRVAKMNAYAAYGVRHYWLVDREAKTLEAFELAEGTYRLAAAVAGEADFRPIVFPELTISLRELWD